VLAARVVMEQGVELHGLSFVTEFFSSDPEKFTKRIHEIAGEINLPLDVLDISSEFLAMLEKPRYGYGANFNPCIDCKILMLNKAKELMAGLGASFVITGEVLGERPMSQRKDALNSVEKWSGLKGYLLRPLSAKLLPPTKPETEGLVDRERLLDLSGRGRKRQFELAEKFGIEKHFTPAGGCLLTDPGFTRRLEDLAKHGKIKLEDVRLLKYGRHFRLDSATKFVLGRDEKDNAGVVSEQKENDAIFFPHGFGGPIGLLRGDASDANLNKAAGFLLTHSKARGKSRASVGVKSASGKRIITVKPAPREEIEAKRI